MNQKLTQPKPEILRLYSFPVPPVPAGKWLARLKAEGKIRSIGPRLYTSVAASKTAEVVRGSWSTLVSHLFPGALLTHRTAFDYKPGPGGQIFLTANTNREITYPGLKLKFVRGPGPLDDDLPFLSLRASSPARTLLENLSTVRSGEPSKIVPVSEIEARLEQILRNGGETALNEIRDRARQSPSGSI